MFRNRVLCIEANRGLPGFIISERFNKHIIWISVWKTLTVFVSGSSGQPTKIQMMSLLNLSDRVLCVQVLVFLVVLLTSSVVFVVYWVGLPFYRDRHPYMFMVLMPYGHWLLLNVVFLYYKACTTKPGTPLHVSTYMIFGKFFFFDKFFFPLKFLGKEKKIREKK